MRTAILRGLQKDGAPAVTSNFTVSGLGPVECVEGQALAPVSAVTRSCFAPQAALWIEFHGGPGHLPAFDQIVKALWSCAPILR
jgi:hypothetical protein